MKLLVGMLSCGENERLRAIDVLKRHSFRNRDLFEIRDRPNKEAHLELYRTFMASITGAGTTFGSWLCRALSQNRDSAARVSLC